MLDQSEGGRCFNYVLSYAPQSNYSILVSIVAPQLRHPAAGDGRVTGQALNYTGTLLFLEQHGFGLASCRSAR